MGYNPAIQDKCINIVHKIDAVHISNSADQSTNQPTKNMHDKKIKVHLLKVYTRLAKSDYPT